MSSPHDPEELIAIVDDNDNVIGKYPRKNHAEGKLHRETSVLIINPHNEILVQVRADSERLDYSASGHFPYDEDYLEGAIREVKEELGLDIPKEKFRKVVKHRIDYSGRYVNNRFITLWEIKGDYRIEDMQIDPYEVRSVKYVTIQELKKIMENHPDRISAGFAEILNIYLDKKRMISR